MSHLENAQTSQTLPVHRCRDFVVTNGVAEGDPISFADELVMDEGFGKHKLYEHSSVDAGINMEELCGCLWLLTDSKSGGKCHHYQGTCVGCQNCPQNV